MRTPQVFLFGEPLSNLDAGPRSAVAMMPADWILVLEEGVVQQIGAPMDLNHHPPILFAAGFPDSPSMNVLQVAVKGRDGDAFIVTNAAPYLVAVPSPLQAASDDTLKPELRRQYLRPLSDFAEGNLHGTVTPTERPGSDTVMTLALTSGIQLIAALGANAVS